jgi:hypothetical protein
MSNLAMSVASIGQLCRNKQPIGEWALVVPMSQTGSYFYLQPTAYIVVSSLSLSLATHHHRVFLPLQHISNNEEGQEPGFFSASFPATGIL